LRTELAAGLALVLALHAAALYGLMKYRLIPLPDKAETLFVTFIQPPEPLKPELPKPKPHEPAKPVKLEKPRPPEPHPHLVVEAPAAPTDYVMPAPPPPQPPAPVVEAPPPPPRPAGPVSLSGELALACPTRTPPKYPASSQRAGESGQVVLRVELDTDGRVDAARIATSSGYKRLDEAALNAVKTWRCNPPLRDGQPVRAVALQPFKFNLE
jgi:periplasmic protein TonB